MKEILIALIFGIICMITWGIPDVLIKQIIDKIGSQKTNLYINGLMSFLYFPIVLFDTSFPKFNIVNIVYLFLFALFDFLGFFLMYKAYKVGKVSVLNPITSSYAALTAIISFLFFGESFSVYKVLAIIIIIIGVLFTSVNFKDLNNGSPLKDLTKGVPLAIMVFCIYGIMNPFWDRYIEQDGWIWLVFISRFITFIIVLIYSFFSKSVTFQIPKSNIFKRLVISALLFSIGNWSFSLGLKLTSATSIVSVIASAYPLVLVVCAYYILKERIAKNQYFGIFLILLGIMITAVI